MGIHQGSGSVGSGPIGPGSGFSVMPFVNKPCFVLKSFSMKRNDTNYLV